MHQLQTVPPWSGDATERTAPTIRPKVGRPSGKLLHAETFEALRKARRLLKTDVASAAGISPAHLSCMLRHQKGASPATVERLAAALGVPAAALFPEMSGWSPPGGDATTPRRDPTQDPAGVDEWETAPDELLPPSGRYSLTPLVALIERATGRAVSVSDLGRRLGVEPATVRRARHVGLSVWQADRYAIAAGYHPAVVWGRDW